MPQAWKIGRPVCSRYASDNALGTADPPHGMLRSDDVSLPFNSGSTAIQMVGTPAATVTCLVDDQFGDRRAGQVGSGHDEAGAGGHGGMGETPRVGVEHRHDREDHVALASAETVDGHCAHGVQERRTVGVDDALRISRRAARVTHARCSVFVVDSELDGVGGREQLLVIEEFVAVEVGRDVALAVVHQHEVLQVLERGQQRGEQAEQRTVDEDHLVVGMVDDVGELLGEQPDVERVQDAPGARGGEVELEVAGGVPGEGGNTAVGGDAETVEYTTEFAGARRPLAVGGPVETVAGRRDDFLVRVVLLGSLEDVRESRAGRLASGLASCRR